MTVIFPAIRAAFLCALMLTGIPVARAGGLILGFGKLIDGTGELLAGNEILVEGDRIIAVGIDLAKEYPEADFIDLGALTGLPGLIDAHTHITYGLLTAPEGDAWAELEALTPGERLEAAKNNAWLTLTTGVTTVRDLNAEGGLDFALRDLINEGSVKGPRIFTAGQGIHPSFEPDRHGERNGVAEVMSAAADRVASGADWIKIFGTTGSASDLSSEQTYFEEEIRAAVMVARQFGKRVAIHSYGPEAVADALRAGVTSIEHAVGLDDETLASMARQGTYYVPTIDHNRYYAAHAAEFGYDEATQTNLRAFVERNIETVARAHEAGVTIVMGSDAVLTGFGENTGELLQFVKAGLSPAEAIETATVNGAALLGLADELGRLAPGFKADIIAVRGDPLADIRALTEGVRWVMAAGQVVYEKD